MPVLFLGHGNPMNAIEDNQYSQRWKALGRSLVKPQAILVISAHWMTPGTTLVDVSEKPRTIHDFHGFPAALTEKNYGALGSPSLATEITDKLSEFGARTDTSWGLDHGAWTVLEALYPKADVPVFQLSIDISKDLNWHFSIGKALAELRHRGVLLLGSGNIVHNLGALRFDGVAHDWAIEFDAFVKRQLDDRNFASLINTRASGKLLTLSNPTLEHYIPAVTIAGASDANDDLAYITEGIDLGALSMRSFLFYSK